MQKFIIFGNFRISNCTFYDEFVFLLSTFQGSCSFYESNFKGKFSYNANRNNGKFNITNNNFSGNLILSGNRFNDIFSINTAKFNGITKIHSNKYLSNSTFAFLEFNNKSIFKNEQYNFTQFQGIEYSNYRHSFENIQLTDKEVIKFRDIYFNDSVYFLNCPTYKMQFFNSYLIHTNFYSCQWNSLNRLIIFNESDFLQETNELNKLENLYRQLKSSFQNSRD